MLQHERFDAYGLALELLGHVRTMAIDALPKGSRMLGQRMVAAGSRLVLEIAAAVAQPSAGGRHRAFRMAIFAATKCGAVLDALHQLALLAEKDHTNAKDIVVRIVRALERRVRALDPETRPTRRAPTKPKADTTAVAGSGSRKDSDAPATMPLPGASIPNPLTTTEPSAANGSDAAAESRIRPQSVRLAAQLLRASRGARNGLVSPPAAT